MKKYRKKKKLKGVEYTNSNGTFLLVDGKLYDSEGNRTMASAVSTKLDPLKRSD